MFIHDTCELCNKKFKNYKSIAIHVRYCPNNIDKMNIEQYYLKYVNPNKGTCKVCNGPTRFLGIALGYSSCCPSKKCMSFMKKNKIKADNKRVTNFNPINPVDCKLCNSTMKSYNSLRNHIPFCKQNPEKISSKQYYDMFYKKDEEGLCALCGKETKFDGIEHGYNKYCGGKCYYTLPYKEKKNLDFLKKFESYKERTLSKGYILKSDVPILGNDKCEFECINCGHTFINYVFNVMKTNNSCKACRGRAVSQSEKLIFQYIKRIFPFYTVTSSENKLLFNREVDIFIKDLNITIEYNGLFWHGNSYSEKNDLWKTEQLIKKNYKHIVIWEDDFSLENKNYEFIFDILNKCINSDYKHYFKNVKYFTTFDVSEQSILNTNDTPPKSENPLYLEEKHSRPIRPEFTPNL